MKAKLRELFLEACPRMETDHGGKAMEAMHIYSDFFSFSIE